MTEDLKEIFRAYQRGARRARLAVLEEKAKKAKQEESSDLE